jgi:hypothetical protein
VYGAVPPDAVKSAVPVALPKHNTLTPVMLAASAAAGCVITTEAVVEHPLASVTVTLYVPATRPVLSSVVTPLPQLNEYGAVPPVAVRLAAPVELPKQRTFVPEMLAASAAAGCVMTTEAVVEQLLASVTVTEYVPAVKFARSSVVAPFDHRYVYAVVPPDTDKLAAPVELAKQRTFVPLILAARAAAGCVITTEVDVEHPLASVTVTE